MVSSLQLYLGLLLLVGVERLVELGLSTRNARAAFARGGVETGRGHFPAMVALHALFLPACFAEAVLFERSAPALWPLALAAVIAAQALRYWAIASLGSRWNVRIVFVPGEAPVRRGPYRWLRHPNYVAVVVELFALPLVHGAWLTALLFSLLNALVLRARIRAEEEALGAPYASSFAGVPRFVPRPEPSGSGR